MIDRRAKGPLESICCRLFLPSLSHWDRESELPCWFHFLMHLPSSSFHLISFSFSPKDDDCCGRGVDVGGSGVCSLLGDH